MAKSSIKLPPVPEGDLPALIAKILKEALAESGKVADNAPKANWPAPNPKSAANSKLPWMLREGEMPPPAPGSGLNGAATAAVTPPKAPKVPKPPKAPKELGPTHPDSVRMKNPAAWDRTYTIFIDGGMTPADAKKASNSAMTMASRAEKEAADAPVRAANKRAQSEAKSANHTAGKKAEAENRVSKKEEREAKAALIREQADLDAQAAGTRAAPANVTSTRKKPKNYKKGLK